MRAYKWLFTGLIVAVLATSAGICQAQKLAAAPVVAAAAPGLPDRIIRPMRAVDPITLRAEGVTLRLWGIKPVQTNETPIELKALDLMDELIQEQQVNCKIAGGAMPELLARCTAQNNQDLALSLLAAGYVIVDRRQTYDSVFATAYEKAQESARLNSKGVWMLVNREDKESLSSKWLAPQTGLLIPLMLLLGPLAGVLIIALFMRQWLKRMSELQSGETERARAKEATLQSRERQVLVTTLEGELLENKNKVDAFLVIYGDMLRNLQDTDHVPEYQQAGDIIQKQPSFSKAVFEANMNRLSLLDIKLAGHLSKLYSSLPKETEYINLDQDVPLETAIKLVEKVMREAENFLAPIDAVIAELQDAEISST